MKRILILLCLIATVGFAQQTGTRYGIVPEQGGAYQVPNKEIQTVAYGATTTIATTHEETVIQFATLTGAMTLNATITDCYKGDKLFLQFVANGSERVVTFNTNFDANGALTVGASSYATVWFIFDGVKWFEVTRQNSPTITANTISVDAVSAKTSGGDITFATPTIWQGTTTTYTASATVSTAELMKGVLVVASGTVTLTLPTASDAGTALGATAGTSYEFVVQNSASGGTATVAVNTGITASGFPGTNTLTLANSSTVGIARFRLIFLSSTAATLARIN